MVIDYINMGKQIANRRKALKFTQAQLSEMAGISEKYLSELECGRGTPSLETLANICCAMNVTINEVLFSDLSKKELEEEELFHIKYTLIQNNELKKKLLSAYWEHIMKLDI